jgi:hypothetical protein
MRVSLIDWNREILWGRTANSNWEKAISTRQGRRFLCEILSGSEGPLSIPPIWRQEDFLARLTEEHSGDNDPSAASAASGFQKMNRALTAIINPPCAP